MKKNVGILEGLKLAGGSAEREIFKKFSESFLVTFTRESYFKNSRYILAFLKPPKEIITKFNLFNEVLLLCSPYATYDARTLDFVDKTLTDFKNRLDKICIILVSRDPDIEKKIRKYINENRDSRIIIPFTYKEVESHSFGKDNIENKFRKYFYNRDLFAIESPLKTDNYFYGRTTVVQELYNKYSLGQHSGLFGLRKSGKTSVMFALERIIANRKGNTIYLDCQNPTIHKSRWYELLYQILKEIKNKYELRGYLPKQNKFTEKKASTLFETALRNYKEELGNQRILLIFDEIENISFKTSSEEHWATGKDFIDFWQTLRAIYQKNEDLFCVAIAGVNPLCVEKPLIETFDNPLFSIISPIYLDLFTVKEVAEMVGDIGRYMGLIFDEEIFTHLTEDYGGHPFLIRHVCSLIHSDVGYERPANITKYYYKKNKKKYDQKIQTYVDLIVSVLKKWYPEEYYMLEVLYQQGNKKFKEIMAKESTIIEHLLGYGIVREDNGNYYITIEAVNNYIGKRLRKMEDTSTLEGKWKEISARRNIIEVKLRKLIIPILKAKYGGETKSMVLESVPEGRRHELIDYDLNAIFNDLLYFKDLCQIILKYWQLFEKIFIDKRKFENYSECINEYRVDAHAKHISDEDFGIVLIAFNWFDKNLKEIS